MFLHTEIWKSVEEFDPAEWDLLVGENTFSSHRFLKCLELSSLPEVCLWHLIVRIDGRAVACTSVYSHPFRLADLAVEIRSLSALAQQALSAFFDTRALVCGLPISLGRRHVFFAPDANRGLRLEIWREIEKAMNTLATSDVRLLAAKEFSASDEESATLDALSLSGFMRCPSPPAVDLPIRWNSFEEYFSSLRSNYRRQLRADLEIEKASAVAWDSCTVGAVAPSVLYRLYLQVMDRAKERFEYLSPAFFQEIARAYPEESELIVGRLEGEVVVYALLVHDHEQTTFLFCGMDYRYVKEHATYRILLQHLVRRAIAKRSQVLVFGQTSYDAKERLGGEAQGRFYFLKARSPLLRQVLQRVKPRLFVEPVRSPRSVFRADNRA